MAVFELVSDFRPAGDQPRAIETLASGLAEGRRDQVLLGVTGSGKTFTIAQVVAAAARPALVLAHNKTLAAQLYQEFKRLFPGNAVEYFVSYYDYYQPEAYVPQSDTYIEKESTINEEIDRMRHAATRSLFERRDALIVASVSCIYGLGSPEAYHGMMLMLARGARIDRDAALRKLVEIQYRRVPTDLERGAFRVRGDVLEIWPSYAEDALRVEFWGDVVEAISRIDTVRGKVLEVLDRHPVYPNSHYVTPRETMLRAIEAIQVELGVRLGELESAGKLLEAQRLHQRTNFDLEMMREVGFCHGIENYSRHLTGRMPGQAPPTLMDYFPRDALLVVDESHATIPQVRGMYHGDRSRKLTLVDFGFRLPSALDNRPLTFDEFRAVTGQVLYVSATPGEYELERAGGVREAPGTPYVGGAVAEQIIRPTGLMDPRIIVRPASIQVDDLMAEVRTRAERDERVLITTLTKRMAEDLTEYYQQNGLRVRYLHSDIDTLDRVAVIRDLRLGKFDALIGINLLREGLDLPEVSLVGILDADKEGYLRSATSLIQTAGRAARHVNGEVLMYADRVTGSMQEAIAETERRRAAQAAYNAEHGITPETVRKSIRELLETVSERDYYTVPVPQTVEAAPESAEALAARIAELETAMKEAARRLDFERAAALRDQVKALRRVELGVR